MSDIDLLPPSIDPTKEALGIRRVSARNEASTRSVMMVRDHVVITDEKGTNTGPTPLEMALSSLLGCEGVIINRCADAMRFAYTAVDMEAESVKTIAFEKNLIEEIEIFRGIRGVCPVVRLTVAAYT